LYEFDRSWVITGAEGRPTRQVTSLYLKDNSIEVHNWKLAEKYRQMEREEVLYEHFMMDDARHVVIAFGTAARVAKTAIQWARRNGIKAGLFRPITLFPFPSEQVREVVASSETVTVMEMNTGQMIDDVKRSSEEHDKIDFYGRPCQLLTPEEIYEVLEKKSKGRAIDEPARTGSEKGL
ncbi:MAG: 3-methyl-2-oxobutanoate dehydrogenase subunit beta, partial [Deltaproteobacteria bacterium]